MRLCAMKVSKKEGPVAQLNSDVYLPFLSLAFGLNLSTFGNILALKNAAFRDIQTKIWTAFCVTIGSLVRKKLGKVFPQPTVPNHIH